MTDRVLECEFPLRENFTATLWLPRDLTAREVERIAAMLQTLVAPVAPEEHIDLMHETGKPFAPLRAPRT